MPNNNTAAAPQASASAASNEGQPVSETTTGRSTVNETVPACGHVPISTRNGVLRLLLFFGIVAGLICLTDFAITLGLRKIETSGFGVTNRMVRGEINAEIVISGSSRAQTHYDPRIIQRETGLKTYNLGRNGSQTDLQLAVLKTYLQHNTKPRLIIHNLDSFAFVTTREIYDPAQYFPYLNEVPIFESIKTVYADAWKWKFPLYAYMAKDMRFTWIAGLRRLIGINPPETHIAGFTPRYTDWTGDFESYRQQNPNGVSFAIESRGVDQITQLVELCREKNIPLLLVYSPVYAEMQSMERNRKEIFELFQSISQNSTTAFWDFSTSTICQNRHFFYNSQHLNAVGAEAFSRELSKQLRAKAPWQ